MNRKSRVDDYLPLWAIESLPPFSASIAKPELCASIETVAGGCTVVRLSEGFPVDRSSYGRLALVRDIEGKV